MLKKSLLLLLLISFSIQGQSFINGSLNSTKKYDWVALYQLRATSQNYVANTAIKDGTFSMEFPMNATKGMYRLLYDLENDGFIDFIYNNETIEIVFDPEKPLSSVTFSASTENQLYHLYKEEMAASQHIIDSLQRNYFYLKDSMKKNASNQMYADVLHTKLTIQQTYEENSVGKLANHFIKSSFKYSAPSLINTPQEYLNSEKKHFFDAVDIQDSELINTPFLSEKVINYVFHLNGSDDDEVQTMLYKKAVQEVLTKVENDYNIKAELIVSLMYTFAQIENSQMTNYLMNNHYDKLPLEFINTDLKEAIKVKIRLAVGSQAPDINWKEDGEDKKLSEIDVANKYILVFWSTSCSHCLIEIPQLYEYTKNKSKLHVIAIALEDKNEGFDKYTTQYKEWTNILALEKWENHIAQTYEIDATPSYFVLDQHKKIEAKPAYFEEVKVFLESTETF